MPDRTGQTAQFRLPSRLAGEGRPGSLPRLPGKGAPAAKRPGPEGDDRLTEAARRQLPEDTQGQLAEAARVQLAEDAQGQLAEHAQRHIKGHAPVRLVDDLADSQIAGEAAQD